MVTKDEIRRRFRALRDQLPAAERAAASSRIAQLCADFLAGLPQPVQRVALYAAIGSEVDTGPLHGLLTTRGADVVYPRWNGSERLLRFAPADHPGDLVPGRYGIPEPQGEPVPIDSIDVVVVPALVFDRAGGRVGYGAGCYDATLMQARGSRIGLAFAAQLIDAVPRADHDQPVDVVITEDAVFSAPRQRDASGVPCPS